MEEFEKMAAAEIEEMEPEAAAADAAEAPTGDMVEESAENGAEMDRAELVGRLAPQRRIGWRNGFRDSRARGAERIRSRRGRRAAHGARCVIQPD